MEKKLGSARFWLIIGIVNHAVACIIVTSGCLYSGFTCAGERFDSVVSVYTFTLFTPQVAIEVIVLLALFLINNALKGLKQNWHLLLLFLVSFAMPIVLVLS